MFLTRHFVFVHVPKTGGSFVLRVLKQHAPDDWQVQRLDNHATYRDIPESHRRLPRLAFARNPYAWHVSWFHFQQQKFRENAAPPLFLRITDGGRLGFADAMRRAYTGNGPLANQTGALTQTLLDMLGQGLTGATVGRIENFREDLLRMFGACTEVPAAVERAIRERPKENTSRHAHYSTYYDDELRAIVREKDAPVFDFFGYEWEQQ